MKQKKMFVFVAISLAMAVGVFLYVQQETPVTKPAVQSLNKPAPSNPQQETRTTNKEDKEKKKNNINEKNEHKPVQASMIENMHIVGLGDSLTKGSGDKKKTGYIESVAQYIKRNTNENVSVKNFGTNGHSSEELTKKLDNEDVQVHLKKADYVLITIGGNDMLNIVEYNFFSLNMELFEAGLERYRKNLFITVQTIRAINPNAKIYLIGMFNPFHNFFQDIKEINNVVEEWNRTIELVANINTNTTYIPIQALFLDNEDGLFSKDNLHPNHKGYLKMAEQIKDFIGLPKREQQPGE